MRDFYRNYYQNKSGSGAGNKVYVSRKKAATRKVGNEDECIQILEEYGFKTICFEDYPFEQQARIALEAQYLVANHGAGLTNIIYMKAGGSVLELRKEDDKHNNCFFALASALQLKYFYQLCDSDDPDEDPNTVNSANITVNCRLLRENIEQMLADR